MHLVCYWAEPAIPIPKPVRQGLSLAHRGPLVAMRNDWLRSHPQRIVCREHRFAFDEGGGEAR